MCDSDFSSDRVGPAQDHLLLRPLPVGSLGLSSPQALGHRNLMAGSWLRHPGRLAEASACPFVLVFLSSSALLGRRQHHMPRRSLRGRGLLPRGHFTSPM